MSVLSEVPIYWLNFMLHTALVSAVALVACMALRDPGRRAFAAAAGVMAIVAVPWFSANRPISFSDRPEESATLSPPGNHWSDWTIRIEDDLAGNPGIDSSDVREIVVPRLPFDWKTGMVGIWMLGGAIGLLLLTARHVELVSWEKTLRRVTDEEWDFIHPIHGIDRACLRIADQRVSPCAIGFFRARVVIPVSLFAPKHREKLGWAVEHEAEHVRGGDPRMALMFSFMKSIMWWNPAVHSLCGQWAENRERVCDARAVGDAKDRAGYGGFLLDLVDKDFVVIGGAVPMSMSRGGKRLRKRLQAMMRGDLVAENSTAFCMIASLVAVGVGVLASCAGVSKDVATPGETTASFISLGKPKEGERKSGTRPMRPVQIKLAALFVRTHEPVPEAGSVLDDRELQLLMRRLAQKKGTDLMTAPSVMGTDERRSEIMIVHTDPKHPNPKDIRTVPFVGLSLQLLPRIEGKELSLSVDCMANFLPGENVFLRAGGSGTNPPGKNFNWSRVRSATANATGKLSAGDAMVVAFKGLEDGQHLTGFFIAKPIDGTGREVGDFGIKIEDPYAVPLDEEFRIRGAILEISKADFIENYVPFEATGSEMDEIRGRVEKTRNAKWVDLEPTTIMSGHLTEPWKAYKGFKLKVTSFEGGASRLEGSYPSGAGGGMQFTGESRTLGRDRSLFGNIMTMEFLPRTTGKSRKVLVMVVDRN